MGDYANYHCFGFNPETVCSSNDDDFEEEEIMYKPKAETSKLKFTSRAAIKVKDNYFTVEATEERDIYPDMVNVELEEEWKALCDSVNSIIDDQVDDIYEHLIKQKK